MTLTEFHAVLEAAAKVCDKYNDSDVGARLAGEYLRRALTPEQAGITVTEGVVVPRKLLQRISETRKGVHLNHNNLGAYIGGWDEHSEALTALAKLAAAQEQRK